MCRAGNAGEITYNFKCCAKLIQRIIAIKRGVNHETSPFRRVFTRHLFNEEKVKQLTILCEEYSEAEVQEIFKLVYIFDEEVHTSHPPAMQSKGFKEIKGYLEGTYHSIETLLGKTYITEAFIKNFR